MPCKAGARGRWSTRGKFTADKPGTAYVAPQVLVDLDQANPIMQEECFGPVVGIMTVGSDEEAIRLMNDNAYRPDRGASGPMDEKAAIRIGDQIETGTWFMNRCDYLDPALAWVGVKDSGRGCYLEPRRLRASDAAEVLPSAG